MEVLRAITTDFNGGIKQLKRNNKKKRQLRLGLSNPSLLVKKYKKKGLLPWFQSLSLWIGVQLVEE